MNINNTQIQFWTKSGTSVFSRYEFLHCKFNEKISKRVVRYVPNYVQNCIISEKKKLHQIRKFYLYIQLLKHYYIIFVKL